MSASASKDITGLAGSSRVVASVAGTAGGDENKDRGGLLAADHLPDSPPSVTTTGPLTPPVLSDFSDTESILTDSAAADLSSR